MDIKFMIADAKANKVIEAICARYSYQTEIDGKPNPQSKANFTRDITMGFWRDNLRAYEKEIINKVAEDTATYTELTYNNEN